MNIDTGRGKDMKTCCCSSHCKKYFDCRLADINNNGMHLVENYHEWGSGTFTDNGCEIEHWCGEEGNYKMFEPIEGINLEVKIPFPFHYLNQYLRGESDWDSAFDNTMEEIYSLIEDYVAKHLKT